MVKDFTSRWRPDAAPDKGMVGEQSSLGSFAGNRNPID